MRSLVLAVLVVAVTLAALWYTRSHSAPPAPVEPPPTRPALNRTQETGRRLYLRYCAACHGEQVDGFGRNSTNVDPPPPPLPASLTRQTFVKWLSNQRPRPAPLCPDWLHTFTPAQINALADYLTAVTLPGP